MTFNSVRAFQDCTAALDALARKEEPQEQESITAGDRLSLSLHGVEIGTRVGRIIQKIFSDGCAAGISTKDLSLFLESWKSCIEKSEKFSTQEKNKAVFRVLLSLFDEKNALSPFKVLEVLHGRPASSLSSVELRALERALSHVSFWHERFKKFLYMICAKYVHTLWRMKLSEAQIEMKMVRGLSSIRVNWEKIPLRSPEAIDIASQFQAAEEKQNKEKVLQRMLRDFSSFNQESQEVLTICAIDFLWHFSWDICMALGRRMPPIPSQEGGVNAALLHPFIAKGVRVLSEFIVLFESIDRSDPIEIKAFEGKPRELIQTLICCARCYNARFHETASLYEEGFLLYKEALSHCKAFSPSPMNELPEPEEFSQDFLPVIDMQSLGAFLPVTLEGMMPLILCGHNDRIKALFTLVFQSAVEGEKVSEFFLDADLVRKKKAQCATASTALDESVASTSSPKSKLH